MKRYSVVNGKLVELQGNATTVVRDSSPGLGDAVAAMAKAAGMKETAGCGCARRRETLNRWTPAWLSQLLGRLGRAGSRPAR